MEQDRSIAVIGLGYVGLPLALGFTEAGVRVTGVDSSELRVAELNDGHSPIEDISDERLGAALDAGLRVVLLTARPMRVQRQTLGWLERYKLRWDVLIMREFGDYQASRVFKQRTVGELRSYGFDLRLAFEDDRRNVDMFHREGVPCVYIHSGYYD